MVTCPCCSGNTYEMCCKPFHEGALPKSALQLMRSRYSAYALCLPEYIMATTHPKNPHYSKNRTAWKQSIVQFSQNSTFHKLEILDAQEGVTAATVTFTAHILQGTHDATFTERSAFEKVGRKWLYRSGSTEHARE